MSYSPVNHAGARRTSVGSKNIEPFSLNQPSNRPSTGGIGNHRNINVGGKHGFKNNSNLQHDNSSNSGILNTVNL